MEDQRIMLEYVMPCGHANNSVIPFEGGYKCVECDRRYATAADLTDMSGMVGTVKELKDSMSFKIEIEDLQSQNHATSLVNLTIEGKSKEEIENAIMKTVRAVLVQIGVLD